MIPPYVPKEDKSLEQRLSEVSILVMEMEGVLTDGRTLVDTQGRESIFIDRRDALALKMWIKDGGKLTLLARADLAAAQEWCRNHGLDFLGHQGAAKNATLQSIIFQNASTPKDVCYLGWDLEDLPPAMIAGVAACPANANVWVRDSAHLVLASPGGRGAVRELIDRLLAGRRPPSE
jgi:3-deoxy-D-manno-octulosonate 8-phosphate phosphatase (KDO 8-P phosphatase)